MNKNEKLAERLELAAKIVRQKLTFEAKRGSYSWDKYPPENAPMFCEINDWDEWEIRLGSQPVMVPLEVSDVPPGSVIRNYAWNETDWVPVAVGGNFVIRLDTGDRLTFEGLMLSWQIQRLGGGWEPCMKEMVRG